MFRRLAFLGVLAALIAATPAFAKDDRVSIGNDITVTDDTTANDLVCVFCSVHVHGNVHGDVVAVLGSVMLDSGRSITGDVVSVGGDVTMKEQSEIGRDVAVVAGDLEMAPGASVAGDRSVESGRGWLLLPFVPLLIFVGIIWLIVYFIQRNRYVFPVYPQGRGF